LLFPLSFRDLTFLLAVVFIILLITLEMLSPHYGKINILINRKKLKNVTLPILIILVVMAAIEIIYI